MLYKNISYSVIKIAGTTFQPGEIKDVGQYITNASFVRVNPSDYPDVKKQVKSVEKPTTEKQKVRSTEKKTQTIKTKESGELNGTNNNQ